VKNGDKVNNHPDARLLQPLKPLLDNQDVTEIVVDGFERVYVRRHGKLEDVPSPFRNQEHLMQVINDLLEALDRQVNRTLPLVNVRFLMARGSMCVTSCRSNRGSDDHSKVSSTRMD
jgi:Flp pilus assembly CpaF family ATPase